MSVSYSVYLVKNRAGFFLDFEHPTFQGRWRLFTNLDFYGILNALPFRGVSHVRCVFVALTLRAK